MSSAMKMVAIAFFIFAMGVLLSSCRADGSVSLEGWKKTCSQGGYMTIYRRDGTVERVATPCSQ
jgi:hypothetical protein